jgi:hypothetical protein
LLHVCLWGKVFCHLPQIVCLMRRKAAPHLPFTKCTGNKHCARSVTGVNHSHYRGSQTLKPCSEETNLSTYMRDLCLPRRRCSASPVYLLLVAIRSRNCDCLDCTSPHAHAGFHYPWARFFLSAWTAHSASWKLVKTVSREIESIAWKQA